MDTSASPLATLNDPGLLKTDALVGGEWSAGPARFAVHDPATGLKLADVARLGPVDCHNAIVAAERAYFDDVGYIPGMHLITVKADLAAAHPWLGAEISRMVDESRRIWTAKRRKYADTTPWMLDELLRCARDLPDDVEASGLAANRSMIADFGRELHVQGILDRALTPDELFPDAGVA